MLDVAGVKKVLDAVVRHRKAADAVLHLVVSEMAVVVVARGEVAGISLCKCDSFYVYADGVGKACRFRFIWLFTFSKAKEKKRGKSLRRELGFQFFRLPLMQSRELKERSV